MPQLVNPHFSGRTGLLRNLQEVFCNSDGNGEEKKHKIFVICAMGGAGKSEFCLKFAYENKER